MADDERADGRHGRSRSLTADPAYGALPGLLIALTVLTGVVDAVSILALGRVFVANMTGNVVFAAFAVVGAPGFSLSASLFAPAGFLVGAYLGGLLVARHSGGPAHVTVRNTGRAALGRRLLAVAAMVAGAVAGAALALRVSPVSALALAAALLALTAAWAALAVRRPASWRAFPVVRH